MKCFVAASLFWFGVVNPAWAVNFLTEENPPLNFQRDGEIGGISTGVVREMAKRASVSASFNVLNWQDAFSRAQQETDSCVYSTVRIPEREKLFQWIGPIGRGEWSLFARAGFPPELKKLDQLMKYRVGVVNDARLAHLRSRGFKNLVVAENNLDLAAMLSGDAKALGRTDLWFTQSAGAQELAKRAGVGDLKLVFSSLMSQDYWLACSPQLAPELVKLLRDAISAMKTDGSFRLLLVPPQRP